MMLTRVECYRVKYGVEPLGRISWVCVQSCSFITEHSFRCIMFENLLEPSNIVRQQERLKRLISISISWALGTLGIGSCDWHQGRGHLHQTQWWKCCRNGSSWRRPCPQTWLWPPYWGSQEGRWLRGQEFLKHSHKGLPDKNMVDMSKTKIVNDRGVSC